MRERETLFVYKVYRRHGIESMEYQIIVRTEASYPSDEMKREREKCQRVRNIVMME